MIEREIDGITRRFVFGTLTFKILKDIAGVKKINEVFERLVNKRVKKGATEIDVFEEEAIADEIGHIDFIVEFLFACAKTAADLKGDAVDFNITKVYGWFDSLGMNSAMSLIKELTEMYTEKNRPALETGQSKEAA